MYSIVRNSVHTDREKVNSSTRQYVARFPVCVMKTISMCHEDHQHPERIRITDKGSNERMYWILGRRRPSAHPFPPDLYRFIFKLDSAAVLSS